MDVKTFFMHKIQVQYIWYKFYCRKSVNDNGTSIGINRLKKNNTGLRIVFLRST